MHITGIKIPEANSLKISFKGKDILLVLYLHLYVER